MTSPYFLKASPTTTCPRCLFDDTVAEIHDYQCEYCHLHDNLEADAVHFSEVLPKIKNKKGKYNCLIGISGGLDSSTLLYAAIKKWDLKPLVIHFDNNWNTPQAKSNMKNLVDKLGVECIVYKPNRIEYDLINRAFLLAGLPDADTPNDIAMTKLMYMTAEKWGIKYILNGHDFRQEGSTPRPWTYMDARYIESVYKKHIGAKIENYPLFTFWDQIWYGIKGIKQLRPFHDNTVHCSRGKWEVEMKEFIGWKDYGDKHAENIYTEFIGAEVLPKKFGIDKRIVYLSAKVRSGSMDRKEAMKKLSEPGSFDIGKIPPAIIEDIGSNIGLRENYARYNFKKYKFIIYLLWMLKVVPQTFLKKYC